MGINGLLPFLEKASEKIHVKTLAGKTVAIDSYCWLHKGAFAVADKLARGEETETHILYCLKYVNMLLSHNIKPILVFDGRHLPAKAETEAKRRENRKAAKQRAIELMRKGNHSEARNYLRRCVDITHEMALKLIQACRQINVDCIVAPYEADGQLAYLNRIKIADYVITEDSDLVLFGCSKILFKLDLAGWCVLVDADKLHLTMNCSLDKYTMEKFRFMCILSGCDYVDSLPGIGLAKACKFILKTEETDMWRALDKIPAYLNMRQLQVTDEYKRNVMIANATFQHMVVYDPRQRKTVRLIDPEEVGTDMEYCCNAGEMLDEETALNLAVGNLNPFTLKALDDWHPDRNTKPKSSKAVKNQSIRASHSSIWQKGIAAIFDTKTKQSTVFSVVKQRRVMTRSSSVRRPLSELDIDEEAKEENSESTSNGSENSEDLLNEYMNVTQPPSKKFKDQSDSDADDEESETIQVAKQTEKLKITPTRNPFKKQQQSTDEAVCPSPTKITAENSSLINNQSPVKRIDFAKLDKLSKFKRTVITEKQNVISRFFGSATSSSNGTSDSDATTSVAVAESNTVSGQTENNNNNNEMLNIRTDCEEKVEASKCLYLNMSKSSDSDLSESITKEMTTVCQRSTLNLEQKYGNKNLLRSLSITQSLLNEEVITEDEGTPADLISSDESQSIASETPIIVTDDEDDNITDEWENVPTASQNTANSLINKNGKAALPQPKKTATCRRPGLSLKKGSTAGRKGGGNATNKLQQTAVQSKLSMFGFQKRPQMS